LQTIETAAPGSIHPHFDVHNEPYVRYALEVTCDGVLAVAQLSGLALAIDVQHVGRGNALAVEPGRARQDQGYA
jgi:hypothetical protein